MHAQTEFPKLLSPFEAAELLRVHEVTIRKWRQAGQGPNWIQVGGRFYYTEADLRDYLKPGGPE